MNWTKHSMLSLKLIPTDPRKQRKQRIKREKRETKKGFTLSCDMPSHQPNECHLYRPSLSNSLVWWLLVLVRQRYWNLRNLTKMTETEDIGFLEPLRTVMGSTTEDSVAGSSVSIAKTNPLWNLLRTIEKKYYFLSINFVMDSTAKIILLWLLLRMKCCTVTCTHP